MQKPKEGKSHFFISEHGKWMVDFPFRLPIAEYELAHAWTIEMNRRREHNASRDRNSRLLWLKPRY